MSRTILYMMSAALLLVAGYKLFDVGLSASASRLALYCGIPLVLALVLSAAARLPGEWRLALVNCLITGLVVVYAADVYISVSNVDPIARKHAQKIAYWRDAGIDYDARTPVELVRALRASGQQVFPKINPGMVRPPVEVDGRTAVVVGTLANSRLVACNEAGQYLMYSSDRHGFNNPDEIWDYAKATLLVVGDSFAEGACIPSNKNIVYTLRDRYPATANLGMGGNGPLRALASLREYGRAKEPALTLWLYYGGNDLPNLKGERENPLLMRYLDPDYTQDLLAMGSTLHDSLADYVEEALAGKHAIVAQPPAAPRLAKRVIDTLFLRNLRLRVVENLFGGPEHLDCTAELELLEQLFGAAAREVAAWQGQIAFVYLPPTSASAGTCYDDARSAVLSAAQSAGMQTLDMTAAVDAHDEPSHVYALGGTGHYHEAGAQFVAQQIIEFVESDPRLRAAVSGVAPPSLEQPATR